MKHGEGELDDLGETAGRPAVTSPRAIELAPAVGIAFGGLVIAALVALTPWNTSDLTGGGPSSHDMVVEVRPPAMEPVANQSR